MEEEGDDEEKGRKRRKKRENYCKEEKQEDTVSPNTMTDGRLIPPRGERTEQGEEPRHFRVLGGQNPALGAAAAVRRPEVVPWEVFLERVHVSYPNPRRVQQYTVPQEESENKRLNIGREETKGVEGYKEDQRGPR